MLKSLVLTRGLDLISEVFVLLVSAQIYRLKAAYISTVKTFILEKPTVRDMISHITNKARYGHRKNNDSDVAPESL